MASNQAKLDGITAFVAVVDVGSFTDAAARMGHSTSFVSKEISRLEDRLGVRLLQRTTRSLHLTEIGEIYFERCRQIVIDAENAERAVHARQDIPRGNLRVSVPVSIGLGHLKRQLPEFLAAHPDLTIDIELNDRMVDLVAEGFDVVIRVGDLGDSNLIGRRIASIRGMVLASPDYWQLHGRPSHPLELASHDCITYSLMRPTNLWEFIDGDGKTFSVKINGRVQCNNAGMEAAMAVAGLGITRLPAFACVDELRSGLLEPALEGYERQPLGVFVVYPHRRHLSAKVRVFVDFLVERFGRDFGIPD